MSIFSKLLRKKKLYNFRKSINLPEMKIQSNNTRLNQITLPKRLMIMLKQHIGGEGDICVLPGEKVFRGQPLTCGTGNILPVHAPTSGIIESIEPHIAAHPSGLSEKCIFLLPDGKDCWIKRVKSNNYRKLPRENIIKLIHEAGIAGLGGAGFPTATKLHNVLLYKKVKTLIINAVECEPYITADDRLLQEYANEVVEGCHIFSWILQTKQVIIAIEDNKLLAIKALKQALYNHHELHIRIIPTKYPSGEAKQLVKIITGLEVPDKGRATDLGILIQNVSTVWAVKRAIINGEPMTERIITVTGTAISKPCNVWARLGTPVSHLLNHVGFTLNEFNMVIMGGPLTGFTLSSLEVPIIKSTNCILVLSTNEIDNQNKEQPCIRCSICSEYCPVNLLPQQLYWYSKNYEHDKSRVYNIHSCIECGICAYICPSHIPLVKYFRQEKAKLRAIDIEAKRISEAKARFEIHKFRLQQEKKAYEAKNTIMNTSNSHETCKTILADALSRAKIYQAQHKKFLITKK
ncbi:electron transport complex subunit RsxC [Pantoea sp. Aalb]|uniref:electron transport complex subunit RsxC n=1 Tax=Pantoea sp. Aalb TaxID=2576762 RepID=UPI0013239082|nr:electron transport complex subunit RsxC [Pantoea sp. Aalb]MXP67411.1 electron transport complex subunit RsxC [Pantoea sp. Aalb]